MIRNIFKYGFLTLLVILSLGCTAKYKEKDLSELYSQFKAEGSFILLNKSKENYIVYNREATEKRVSPASTFKIYNSLFALDSGVATGKDHLIKWDNVDRDYAPWNKDHTLKSAVKNSVVWYFQEIARNIGHEKMSSYISRIEYGNQLLTPAIDNFWLAGGLKISPEEQLDLIVKLYNLELPFSREDQEVVKDMIVLDRSDDYILSGKTGLIVKGNRCYASFVGYIETNDDVCFFVTNLDKNYSDLSSYTESTKLTYRILSELNIF